MTANPFFPCLAFFVAPQDGDHVSPPRVEVVLEGVRDGLTDVSAKVPPKAKSLPTGSGTCPGGQARTKMLTAPATGRRDWHGVGRGWSERGAVNLLGREREIAALSRALDSALEGRGGLIVLVGDAGMGKSSLCRQVADAAAQLGARVVSATAWEAVDAPAFWPWMQILRQLEAREGDPDLFLGREERFEMFDAIAERILEAAREHPLVMVLEDLHATDQSTLALLRFVVRAVASAPVLVVATVDPGQAPGRSGLEAGLTQLEREGETVVLAALDEDSVATLCAHVSGEPLSDSLVLSIYQATEGNPLFVIETVRVLTARGNIHRPDYSIGFRVPQGLKGMIRRRLEGLGDEVIALLSIASVLGRSFDAPLLQAVADVELDALLDRLDRAVAIDVLEESSALGRYRFTHIMVREALYEDLSSARRMRLHRAAAEAIERAYPDELEPRLAELAHHWFKAAQAGDPGRAVEYCRRAARAAEEQGATEEAQRLYRRALKVAESAGRSADVAELRNAIARAMPPRDPNGSPPGSTTPHTFKKEGEYWTISFEGEVARLKDTRGLRHLHVLLQNPGREVHVLELVQGGAARRHAPGVEEGLHIDAAGLGSILDDRAKAAYRARLEDLEEELQQGTEFNDPERVAKAQEEIDALTSELARAFGLAGRDREGPSDASRARVAVQKATKSALLKVRAALPALGEHFDATVRTGTFCIYQPDPRVPVEWELR